MMIITSIIIIIIIIIIICKYKWDTSAFLWTYISSNLTVWDTRWHS
jgi:hypothetical protein